MMKQWYLAVLLLAAWTVQSATYYVATNGLDTRTGLDYWTNAVATISNAVFKAAASEGNLVLVSNGTYMLSATISVTNSTILRSFKDDAVDRAGTIVDGNGVCRCFSITHASALLDGFTVTNGYTTYGGGVYLTHGTVTNCLITGNRVNAAPWAYGGGGICMRTGSVLNCTISGNLVTNGNNNNVGGGGVFVRESGLLRDCTISNNFSITNFTANAGGAGGGVFIFNDKATTCIVEHCTIVNNLSSNSDSTFSSVGGGIFAYNISGGLILVTNCTISGNIAYSGAGIYFRISSGTLVTDCLVSNNWTFGSGVGGGICMYTGTVFNCTIVNNRAGLYDGGGIYLGGLGTVDDCDIRGNFAGGNVCGGGVCLYDGVLKNSTITENSCSNSAWNGGGGVSCIRGGVVSNCLILSNSAQGNIAGGMFCRHGGLVLNCTISGNINSNGTSGGAGGLILSQGGIVRNCLIAGNIATNARYGGVYAESIVISNGSLSACTIVSNRSYNGYGGGLTASYTNTIVNCIIYTNYSTTAANNDIQLSQSESYTSNSFSYCCSSFLLPPANHNITNAPQFTGNGDYHLVLGSPGINAGTNQDWMINAIDRDGRPRIDKYSGIVDIGCYEYLFSGTRFTIP